MWWPNHIVHVHVSRVAKNIACSVWKTSQDCISVYMLWWSEIWENHFNLHTIITVWWGPSPTRYILYLPHFLEYTLVIIYKAFWFFCFYFSLHFFFFKQIMHGYIRDRKEIPNDVKHLTFQFCYAEAHKCHWHCTFVMPKHTDVIS